MRTLAALALAVALLARPAFAEPPEDVKHAPSCKHCGMDRDKFGSSRMLLEYDDGAKVGVCSVHCASVDLAVTLDGSPKQLQVADAGTRALVDAEKAFWVIGGSKPGVMTRRAKWAFAERGAAEAFARESGGKLGTFEDALKASYEDLYQDTKMIREKRKAMKAKAAAAAAPAGDKQPAAQPAAGGHGH